MKNIWKLLGAFVVLGVAFQFSHAAQTCQRTDFLCFESGPSQNLSTPFRVDSSGNITTTGNVTVTGNETVTGSQTTTGNTIYVPSATVTVSTTSTISPTSTVIVIQSSGAVLTMAGSGTNNAPVIATATATNGQYLILESTNGTGSGSVNVSSGTAAGLHLGAATRLISQYSVLTLIYDSTLSMWKEISYGSN